MSMARLVSQLVGTAFDVIDDLAPAGRIKRDGDSTYDPETGNVISDGEWKDVDQIIPTRFKADELDSSVHLATDAKFIVYAKHLPYEPKNNDTIDFKQSIWNVEKVMGVPGDSIWILHVRER